MDQAPPIRPHHCARHRHRGSPSGCCKQGSRLRYLALLVEEGYLKRAGRDFYTIDDPKTRSLKAFLNIEALDDKVHLPDWAIGIGLYGSWATGTNASESDLDLWLLVEEIGPETELEVARLERDLSAAMGCEATILVLTMDKLAALRGGLPILYEPDERG